MAKSLVGRQMSSTAAAVAGTALTRFMSLAEELHAAGADGATAGELLHALRETDATLAAAARQALAERAERLRAAQLAREVEEKQEAVRQLAHKMYADEIRLSALIERSHEALATADAARSSGRQASVATIIEYAERVSYSNAAPLGSAAFDGAAKGMFFQGWGTPTPQQHMVGASRFAMTAPAPSTAAAGGPSQPAASQPAASMPMAGSAPAPPAPSNSAPAFTAVAPPAAPPSGAGVSFFDDDDDSDDFE